MMRAVPWSPAWTLAAFAMLSTAPASAGAASPAAASSSVTGAMRSPIAVAVAGDRLFIADFDDDRVVVTTRAGEPLYAWGATGTGPGEFRGPAGVAIEPDGSVLVTDHYNGRVQRFTADGRFVAGWSLGEKAAPFGVAVDARGSVYVTDLDAGTIGVWSADGVALASFGARGRGPGQLSEPWGIAVEGAEVWVADHGNHRVQRFTTAGEWLGAWGEAGPGEDQLLGPMGLAVGRDGSLYVTDLMGGRVRSFDRSGRVLARWGTGDGVSPDPLPGLAVDGGSDLYLTGPGEAGVVRVAAAAVASSVPAPAAFAMRTLNQPLGSGPVTLELAIPGPGTVSAEIFSLDGRKVAAIPGSSCVAGIQRLAWNAATDQGRDAPTGVYFVRVHFEDSGGRTTRTGRVIVLR